MVTLEEAKKLMETEISRAKKLLTFGPGIESPRWLEATPEHSFGKEEHMVRIIVLEGSPPKGYILADYTNGLVKIFRASDLRTLKTFKTYAKGETLGLNKNSNKSMEEKI